ncbi:PLP-dependent aminotransferase family protein [Chitinispirillales bacterium ANBcel5]|uniref:aminotransferase-like domain-containing protein n=1 Tax=Cellulosispirillum alkaliphilum TaxID=3039283 RepID=UPI002A545651|nr:PLP-dependent aminotransferase family protein [Chitinispirillales bacterium ANBcel5]
MMINFSTNARNMRSSEIRKLMKLAADPSIISFAGGMPANDLFPIEMIDELYNNLPKKDKQAAMQYGPTEGYPPLLEALKNYLISKGFNLDGQGLIVTTGAQQAINLVSKVMLDPGDTVITEYPSFIGALAAFKSYDAITTGVEMDQSGIMIEKLEKTLDQIGEKAKILYLSPYFHNPAGIIYSKKRKEELLKLLENRNICLLEDDPYGELYFDENDKELTIPMKAMGSEPVPICYTGSFAKIFGPGLRLGWLLAPEAIIEKCQLAKQSMDACTSTFTQVLAAAYLNQNKLGEYLNILRPTYARRAQTMLHALEENMPAGITWTKPKGGFYIWVTLPETVNATDVFNISVKNGAAFVIGSAFDPEGKRNNSFRLAFSHTPEGKIGEGVKIVADAVKACL